MEPEGGGLEACFSGDVASEAGSLEAAMLLAIAKLPESKRVVGANALIVARFWATEQKSAVKGVKRRSMRLRASGVIRRLSRAAINAVLPLELTVLHNRAAPGLAKSSLT